MIRKETVLFEIEKIAQVIARILGLKKQGDIEQAHELSVQAIEEYFQLSLDKIEELSSAQLAALLDEKNYPPEKLDLLAQLIFETAHPFQDIPAVYRRLHSVLAIFSYLETQHHTQSFNNLAKREMIDKFLNNQQYE